MAVQEVAPQFDGLGSAYNETPFAPNKPEPHGFRMYNIGNLHGYNVLVLGKINTLCNKRWVTEVWSGA